MTMSECNQALARCEVWDSATGISSGYLHELMEMLRPLVKLNIAVRSPECLRKAQVRHSHREQESQSERPVVYYDMFPLEFCIDPPTGGTATAAP
jgi:hypothetical protein